MHTCRNSSLLYFLYPTVYFYIEFKPQVDPELWKLSFVPVLLPPTSNTYRRQRNREREAKAKSFHSNNDDNNRGTKNKVKKKQKRLMKREGFSDEINSNNNSNNNTNNDNDNNNNNNNGMNNEDRSVVARPSVRYVVELRVSKGRAPVYFTNKASTEVS